MKARVNRTLQGGVYSVAFVFSDFTQEELAKMKSFGVPQIQVRIGNVGRQAVTSVQITQMNGTHVAGFTSEEAAKSYEESVFAQAKSAMDAIRQRKDDFSSTVEVEI